MINSGLSQTSDAYSIPLSGLASARRRRFLANAIILVYLLLPILFAIDNPISAIIQVLLNCSIFYAIVRWFIKTVDNSSLINLYHVPRQSDLITDVIDLVEKIGLKKRVLRPWDISQQNELRIKPVHPRPLQYALSRISRRRGSHS